MYSGGGSLISPQSQPPESTKLLLLIEIKVEQSAFGIKTGMQNCRGQSTQPFQTGLIIRNKRIKLYHFPCQCSELNWALIS